MKQTAMCNVPEESRYSLFEKTVRQKHIKHHGLKLFKNRLIALLFGGASLFGLAINHAHAVGASTPFTTIEAESGTLAGGASVRTLVVAATPPTISSPELEASGRSFVQLTATGQSVSWTNPVANATAVNIRFCIPDGLSGGGTTNTLDLYVDGVFRQALTLNSSQAWLYETNLSSNGQSNTPGTGLHPHLFWDEMHTWITGAAIAAGSTITLQMDSTNSAAYYYIDCIDLEAPPAALSQLTNSLSVTAYGAVGDGSTDCTTAIQNCFNAAKVEGKSVWMPSGTFVTSSLLIATGITVSGAGPWYTTIYAETTGGVINVETGATLENLYINTNSIARGSAGNAISPHGSNWTVNNVWLQHTTDVAIFADGSYGLVENCRVANSFADGVNLNNGANATGNNLTATNNFVRGCGDDGLAIYSNSVSGGGTTMNTILMDHNTSIASWWANGLRIAGGTNLTVSNNLITDSVTNQGMFIGYYNTGDDDTSFPVVDAVINNNTIERCGGTSGGDYGMTIAGSSTQPTDADVYSNTIEDSLYIGVKVGPNVTLTFGSDNEVINPGTTGIYIESTATGSGDFYDDTVSGINSGQEAFINDAGTGFTLTESGNTGF